MMGLKGIPCPGGVETVVEEIGSRLVKRGHEVIVFVRPHYNLDRLKEYKGMRLITLPSIPTKNLDAITHSLLSVFGSIAVHPDIVHIQITGNSIYSYLPRIFGIPSIVTSHGLEWQRAKWGGFAKRYLQFTDRTTCYLPSAATAVSQKMQRYYQETYKRKVFYIPNGANPVDKLPPGEIQRLGLKGNDYLFFAARLVPEKGCHYLIEAFKRLDTDKKLVIAGDGFLGDPYAEGLKKEASEKILFLGFVKGNLLKELLSNAYLYILPSEMEGLSTGLIEAMSYRNCVLVSDIEENKEAIGGTGFTFKNKSVSDLSARLAYLVNHPEIVDSEREKCYANVHDRYDWDSVTSEYENLYRGLTWGI